MIGVLEGAWARRRVWGAVTVESLLILRRAQAENEKEGRELGS